MTDSVYKNIKAAIEDHLNDVSGLPTIYNENLNIVPTTGTSFIKTRFTPTNRVAATRGSNPQHYYAGFFTCLIHTPENVGSGLADGYVDKIVNAFNTDTDISYTPLSGDDVFVRMRYTERQGSYDNTPWYIVPVQIGWYVYQ